MKDNSKHTLPVLAILGGTGKEGTGLALRWAKVGYRVIIGSRLQDRAQAAADELNTILDIDTIQGMENNQAAENADICILTVVQSAHHAALTGLKESLQGKILIDATARVEYKTPVPPEQPSAGFIAQEILGEKVYVVAAFQNVPAHVLSKDLEKPVGVDVLVCGDHMGAVEKTLELAQAAGMRAFYAGKLENAVVVEGLTALLISMNKFYKTRNASISVTGIELD